MNVRRLGGELGVSIVEVILGVAIITLLVGSIGYSVTTYVDTRAQLLYDTKSLYLTEEGLELLRAARDNDWSTIDGLTKGDDYYFDLSGGGIVVGTTPEVVDGIFTRTFTVDSLYRNGDDDVVDSAAAGASVDDEGRVVEMRVIGPNGTTQLDTIITNLHAS